MSEVSPLLDRPLAGSLAIAAATVGHCFETIVLELDLLADGVMRVVLLPVEQPVERLPGQYLDLLLPGERRRSCSIANAPHTGPWLELHVGRVEGGALSQFVFEQLRTGDSVWACGPHGSLAPILAPRRPILFVAGGTGVAPIKALVEHYLQFEQTPSLRLYWGVRSRSELYLQDEVQTWARDGRLHYVPVLSEHSAPTGMRSGLVHQAVLDDLPDLIAHDVFLSGPPAMLRAAAPAFLAAGLRPDRLFHDGAWQ